MEKFRDLKMGASSFNYFYSEFVCLASNLEYTSKLTPRLQDRLDSGVELPTSISALAKRCLCIYEQMQAMIGSETELSLYVQHKLQLPQDQLPGLTKCQPPIPVATTRSRVYDIDKIQSENPVCYIPLVQCSLRCRRACISALEKSTNIFHSFEKWENVNKKQRPNSLC